MRVYRGTIPGDAKRNPRVAWVKNEGGSYYTSPDGKRWYSSSTRCLSHAKEHAEGLWLYGDAATWRKA